jgi:mono/diheme cytochrome c family protein
MGASGAYNLQESELTLEERINVITNGRKAMTAFEALLDEKEIKAVAKYTMKLGQ